MQDQWGLDDLRDTFEDIHTITEHIDSSRNPGNTLSHANSVAIDDNVWRRGFRLDGYWHWLGRRARGIAGTSNHKVSSDAAGIVTPLYVGCDGWGHFDDQGSET